MADDVDKLAEDYWAHYLAVNPTEAHLLGVYDDTGSFESASRQAQEADVAALRELAARAEALDEAGLEEGAAHHA